METIFETHPYLYVLLDPKNPWKNEGFYTPNKREKHPKNEGNVGSYMFLWCSMDKPLKQPKVHRCRCDISFPSRYLDASGPHGMMWRRTQKTQVLFWYIASLYQIGRIQFHNSILGILEYNERAKCATFCLSSKKRGWSKLLQSVCLEMFQVWVHQEHRRPVFCFGGKSGCHEAGLQTDTPSVIPKSIDPRGWNILGICPLPR